MTDTTAPDRVLSRNGTARLTIKAETLRRATLWVMVFGGSFTMIEPSPYELFGAVAILTWVFGGLTLRREFVPIILLLLVYISCALVTLIPVMHLAGTAMWTGVGWYLAFTAMFFMMVLSQDTAERLDIIVGAYVPSAVLCAAVGVLGYAHALPGSEALLLYGRVKSTFEDPNVFAPYLIFPALILTQRIFIKGLGAATMTIPALLVVLAGIFLSFSRGAWGHLAASFILMTLATLWCARSRRLRTRIVLLCLLGGASLVMMIGVLLSLDAVKELFEIRASLDQSYDTGQFGRFGRHWLAFLTLLERPIGIGMLQARSYFGEDIHNTYINAFLSYGWAGGIVFPLIVVLTCFVGWAYCLRPSPWRHIFICAVATYQVTVLEAWIIDVDHWRHVYLLLGLIWGLAVATARLDTSARSSQLTASPR
jgi:hypothetical protein